MIKYRDPKQGKEERVGFRLYFQRMRVHNGGEGKSDSKNWKLAPHIPIHTQQQYRESGSWVRLCLHVMAILNIKLHILYYCYSSH